MKKIGIYGLQNEYLDWIKSYLSDRFQYVLIDHVFSRYLHCEVGVPQGSILGPLLFLIYFNDLPSSLHHCNVDSYADDTTVSVAGEYFEEIENKLTSNCEKLSKWMKMNKLKLNPDKTHLMTKGTAQKLSNIPRLLKLKMDSVLLNHNESGYEKLLGCNVSKSLKWNHQVQEILAKLVKRLV